MSSPCVSGLVLALVGDRWQKKVRPGSHRFPLLTCVVAFISFIEFPGFCVCLHLAHCKCLEGQGLFCLALCLLRQSPVPGAYSASAERVN